MAKKILEEDTRKGRFFSGQFRSSLRCLIDMALPSGSSKLGASFNAFVVYLLGNDGLRWRPTLTALVIKLSLMLLSFLAILWYLRWTISITSRPSRSLYTSHSWLQKQLISDMLEIGELSLNSPSSKNVEYCSKEFENHVPCFNISQNLAFGYSNGDKYDRHCGLEISQICLVLPPSNYRIPIRWPTGRDVIWSSNVKITARQVLSSGSLTKRMMMLDEDQISFRSDPHIHDGIDDYTHQIAVMLGLHNESSFIQAGVRTILDVGCGYGSFGAHLSSNQILTMCIANFESSGSQVQVTLERGLPAMIGSFISKQFPYPSLSFDMVHCVRCGINWEKNGGIYLLEVDRLLKPGGFFIWTSPIANVRLPLHDKKSQKRWNFIHDFAETLCWSILSQQDETVVWKKTSVKSCYASRKQVVKPPICSKRNDIESPYYHPLRLCIGGTQSRRWIPIGEKPSWPLRAMLNSSELQIYDVHPEDFAMDVQEWEAAVQEYWTLLSPVIFSNRPKRLGDEDLSAPSSMFRNILDMNAWFGGFNHALLKAGKNVWVMNVVPKEEPNYLPMIIDRGLIGVLHDWCEAFPTYPRTYDIVHANGLLSVLQRGRQHKCSTLDVLIEVDRMLRPEGWVIFRDDTSLIESARALTSRLRWEARVVETETTNSKRILVCYKPFTRRRRMKFRRRD